MRFYRSAVSVHFRQVALAYYPKLKDNPGYMRFFEYLCLGGFMDKITENLLIPAPMLAQIEDVPYTCNYVGRKFLEAFQRDIMLGFEWSRWDVSLHRARQVTRFPLHPEVKEALDIELNYFYKKIDKVYMDGTEQTEWHLRSYRYQQKAESMERMAKCGCEDARKILDYMTNLPYDTYLPILKKMPEAVSQAQKLDGRSRLHALKVLRNINLCCQPFLTPSEHEKTVRLYGRSAGLLNLKREIRQTLTSDWRDYDLRSCHFAIAGQLWNSEKMVSYSKKSIWHEFNVEDKKKEALKIGLYALIYGAKQLGVKRHLIEKVGKDLGESFMNHELIVDIVNKRDSFANTVIANGGLVDCYGRQLSTKDNDPYSILAQANQAVEMKLLSPVIDYADEKIQIPLWQHDGFSVSSVKDCTKELKEIVDNRCREMGIPTELITK